MEYNDRKLFVVEGDDLTYIDPSKLHIKTYKRNLERYRKILNSKPELKHIFKLSKLKEEKSIVEGIQLQLFNKCKTQHIITVWNRICDEYKELVAKLVIYLREQNWPVHFLKEEIKVLGKEYNYFTTLDEDKLILTLYYYQNKYIILSHILDTKLNLLGKYIIVTDRFDTSISITGGIEYTDNLKEILNSLRSII